MSSACPLATHALPHCPPTHALPHSPPTHHPSPCTASRYGDIEAEERRALRIARAEDARCGRPAGRREGATGRDSRAALCLPAPASGQAEVQALRAPLH